MLMLSDFYFSKEKRDLWSVGCGSTGCDDSNGWYFGGTGKNWYVKVPVGSTFGFTKQPKIIYKGIS